MSASETPRWFPNTMPQPMVDQFTHPWWQACTEHRLTVQRCGHCKHAQHPPAPLCSECHSKDLAQVEVNGNGTIYTYTIAHQPVSPDQSLPFVIAVIELDTSDADCGNAVRIMSNIVDCDPESLAIDQAVHVAWETMSEFVSIPRFKLVD